MLNNAIDLKRSYGFTYKQKFVSWTKFRKGKPATLKGVYSNTCVEDLLIATRGETKRYKTTKTCEQF